MARNAELAPAEAEAADHRFPGASIGAGSPFVRAPSGWPLSVSLEVTAVAIGLLRSTMSATVPHALPQEVPLLSLVSRFSCDFRLFRRRASEQVTDAAGHFKHGCDCGQRKRCWSAVGRGQDARKRKLARHALRNQFRWSLQFSCRSQRYLRTLSGQRGLLPGLRTSRTNRCRTGSQSPAFAPPGS